MNAPLSRDQQIELMKNATKRHEERFAVWIANSTVRQALCRAAPGQVDEAAYTQERKRVAC